MMKNIKKFFTSKITLAALACLLLVGVFAGVTTLATESTPALELTSIELNHDATPTLKYNVTISDISSAVVADADKYEMRFWAYEPASVTEGNYDVASVANSRAIFADDYANGTQTVSFYSTGFAPVNMTDTIFAAAVYLDADGNIIASTAVKAYSIFEYICESGLTANSDQKALYAALEDYIAYAQQYLGYDSETVYSPADLGYFKITNGKFYTGTYDSETKKYSFYDKEYTSGTFLIGTCIKLVADYDVARFTRVGSGGIMNTQPASMSADNEYITSVAANDPIRHYMAHPASNITVNAADGLEIVSLKAVAISHDYSYAPVKYYTGSFSTRLADLHHEKVAVIAPLFNNEGVMLTGWADAEGNIVSEDPAFFIYPLVDKTVYNQTIDFPYTPVYEGRAYDRIADFDAATQDGASIYDLVTTAEDGTLIFDSTSRNVGSTGRPMHVTATESATALEGAYTEGILSIDFQIDGKEGTDYSAPTMANFFATASNTTLYQVRHGYEPGAASLSYIQLITKADNGGSLSSPVHGFFVNLAENGTGGANTQVSLDSDDRLIMDFGVENNITIIYDIEVRDENVLYQKSMTVFVNGLYAGTVQAIPSGSETIAYGDNLYCNWSALMRTGSKVSVFDMTYTEGK